METKYTDSDLQALAESILTLYAPYGIRLEQIPTLAKAEIKRFMRETIGEE